MSTGLLALRLYVQRMTIMEFFHRGELDKVAHGWPESKPQDAKHAGERRWTTRQHWINSSQAWNGGHIVWR